MLKEHPTVQGAIFSNSATVKYLTSINHRLYNVN